MTTTPDDDAAFAAQWRRIVVPQDEVLLSITEGHLNHAALRLLPPWRAVILARVALKAGVMYRADCDDLVREAALVGGDGELRPWDRVRKRADG